MTLALEETQSFQYYKLHPSLARLLEDLNLELLAGVVKSDSGHPKPLCNILPDIPVVLVITLEGDPGQMLA